MRAVYDICPLTATLNSWVAGLRIKCVVHRIQVWMSPEYQSIYNQNIKLTKKILVAEHVAEDYEKKNK